MKQRTRAYIASGFIVFMFLLVQLGALALVEPFKAAGLQAVENPQDPTNSFVYVGAILVATVIMLVAIRLGVDRAIRALIIFSSVYLAWFVFRIIIPNVVTVGGLNVLGAVAALLLGVVLYVYPEWYVIDSTGVIMGAGGAGLFGISFGLLPAIVLLVVLAVYDAISVYGTEHMLTLASGVMDLKVPIILVVPLTLSYSFLDAEMPDPTGEVDADVTGDANANADAGASSDNEQTHAQAANGGTEATTSGETVESKDKDKDKDKVGGEDGDGDKNTEPTDPLDRDALFIGLGDAVIPTVLVASAAFFAPESVPTLGVPGIALTVPALTAMIGMTIGLIILLRMVIQGRAHAGLPLLNGGTIAGYLIGALASGMSLVQALGLAPYL